MTAVDASIVGLRKADALATERGVTITSIQANLSDYKIELNRWSGITAFFCHLPQPLRKKVHNACVDGLVPGGVMVLEAFAPEQLKYDTGGPKVPELLMSFDDLKVEFSGLDFVVAQQVIRERREGIFHAGKAAVVQIFAKKA